MQTNGCNKIKEEAESDHTEERSCNEKTRKMKKQTRKSMKEMILLVNNVDISQYVERYTSLSCYVNRYNVTTKKRPTGMMEI